MCELHLFLFKLLNKLFAAWFKFVCRCVSQVFFLFCMNLLEEEAKETVHDDEEEVLGRGDNGPPTNGSSAADNEPDNDGPSNDRATNIVDDEQRAVSPHVETNLHTENATSYEDSNVSQENGSSESNTRGVCNFFCIDRSAQQTCSGYRCILLTICYS